MCQPAYPSSPGGCPPTPEQSAKDTRERVRYQLQNAVGEVARIALELPTPARAEAADAHTSLIKAYDFFMRGW